jgi:hypothetical protein
MLKQNIEEESGSLNRSSFFSQLAVINSQCRRDFDTVALRNKSHICKCQSAECMACIGEAKLIRFMGNPGIRGGFTVQQYVFITWLHLPMLIDIHTPLVIPNRVPVDARYGETIDLDSIPVVVLTIEIFELSVVPLNKSFYHKIIPPTTNEHANYDYYKSIGGYTEGADATFEMHNSACRLNEDQLSVINARMFNTCQIATLRENAEGYVCINPQY